MTGQGSFALGYFNLFLQALLFCVCTLDSPRGVPSAPFWRRGSLSPTFSYSTAALSPPLPQRAEETLCGVPCASERNDNIPAHPGWQAPSCRGPVAVLSYLSGPCGLAVPVQIAARCCCHSCHSWVGTAIPDAPGEGKGRIIMAISHCSCLKPVSLGDGIFPR